MWNYGIWGKKQAHLLLGIKTVINIINKSLTFPFDGSIQMINIIYYVECEKWNHIILRLLNVF